MELSVRRHVHPVTDGSGASERHVTSGVLAAGADRRRRRRDVPIERPAPGGRYPRAHVANGVAAELQLAAAVLVELCQPGVVPLRAAVEELRPAESGAAQLVRRVGATEDLPAGFGDTERRQALRHPAEEAGRRAAEVVACARRRRPAVLVRQLGGDRVHVHPAQRRQARVPDTVLDRRKADRLYRWVVIVVAGDVDGQDPVALVRSNAEGRHRPSVCARVYVYVYVYVCVYVYVRAIVGTFEKLLLYITTMFG